MVIADASVLIALAKTDRLWLLQKLYGFAVMGPAVKGEVIDGGKAMGAPEVGRVERGMDEGWVRVVAPSSEEKGLTQQLLDSPGMGDGEAESLSLARLREASLLVDDKEARATAGALDIEYVGTAGVLLGAFARGFIDHDELGLAVKGISKVIWLSPDVVADVLRIAKEMGRG